MPDEIELTIRGALEAWIDGRPADAAYELREALRAVELELPAHPSTDNPKMDNATEAPLDESTNDRLDATGSTERGESPDA